VVLQSVVFGILAALGWGISDFSVAMFSKRIGVFKAVLGVHLAAVGATTVYLVFTYDLGRLTLGQWGLLTGLGLLALIIYLLFYRALQIGPIALISPIVGSYAVVVILLAAAVVGERLNALQIIGTAASIAGVVLASLDFRALSQGKKLIGVGVLLAIAATVGLGVWQFSLGVLSRELGWFLPIYVSRLMTLAFLMPITLLRREWIWHGVTPPLIIGVAFAGILETGGLCAFSRG